ncbi:armadillo-type protein [Jimgerdemannia flammicorona]|uniref:Armadillo-type protein n=1 Tax=Jimgerdemannia flammicorona TaxID=994334 RepID=A0A433D6K5_9FUNG|nr:armadillo-type protein [Jimgerdemannia flammicorona]
MSAQVIQQPPDAFTFDEQKLLAAGAADKQEIFLFQWLAHLERELKTVNQDVLRRSQYVLEKTLLRITALSSVKPRRPIRRLLARAFVLLYTRGETRTLFDTVTALHSLVNAGKNVEKEAKVAAVHCIGVLMEHVGNKIISLFPETASIFLKVIKNSSQPLIMRLETINSLTMLFKGAGKAASDQTIKDVGKQLKAGLTDKAMVIRVASTECMQATYQHVNHPLTTHDVELLLPMLFKTFDGSTFTVRRAIASLCATILALTQTTTAVDIAKTGSSKRASGTGSSSSPALSGSVVANGDGDSGVAPERSLMTPEEMLAHLSTTYNRIGVSRETRTGVIEIYASLFINLGTKWAEQHYATITRHLLVELADNARNTATKYDALSAREHVAFLLHDVIGKRLLSEQGQAAAVRVLITDWIKNWPALMPNQTTPSKWIIVCAVNECSALLWALGGAANTVQDLLVDPLLTLLAHTSFSVQVATAWCLRCLCLALPNNLPQLLPKVLKLLEKDLSNLSNTTASPDLHKRIIGYAHAAAAIMAVIPARSLYVSFDLSARAFALATQLLKNTHKDPKFAAVQIQTAWILVGSLMCLGPNLVKLHLPQLLLLWKTALPKPTGKETNSLRTDAEWSALFHAREHAIASIYSFLAHNARHLVTLDIAKRLVALLNNTLAFLSAAPATLSSPTPSATLPYSLKLSDQNYSLRRRIYQCFVAIRPPSAYDSLYSSLLRGCLTVFADPDKIVPSAASPQVVGASAPGTFVSVWSVADGHGFGVTSKMQGYYVDVAPVADDRDDENNRAKDWMTRDRFRKVESQLDQPVIGSAEQDSLLIYTTFCVPSLNSGYRLARPVVPSTAYVDTSIELFATLFPIQTPPIQESTLEQILRLLRDPKLEKNSPKKMAVLVNVVVALLGALKTAMAASGKKGDGETAGIASGRVAQMAQEVLQEAIIHPDAYVRNAASDALGRLTSIIGSSLIASQIQFLVDQVVNNRDPDARAGSALALGSIYSHVGGMAASVHLKTIVGILLSLSSDPHPVVHAWALDALASTVGAAGLMFSGYVNSTLALMAKLYLAETHEPGGPASGTSNAGMTIGFSAYQQFGRIIYELVGTLGPELQASSKVRELCLNMVEELKYEPDQRVTMEAIRCSQHFMMFAPQYVDMSSLIPFLQSQLTSTHLPLKKAAVTCLYQLVQRDVKVVFECSQPGLDDELFYLLDTDPSLSDVKDVIRSWLKQTAVDEPSMWVNITKKVMSRTGSAAPAPAQPTSAVGHVDLGFDGDADDDEGDDFDIDQGVDVPKTIHDLADAEGEPVNLDVPPRWRTQLFALQCLHQAIDQIAGSGIPEHFDLGMARKKRQQAGAGDFLVFRVGDLIKLAFSAATAHVNEMRLEGMTLLRDVLEKFAATPDPDFEDGVLLEQYSAQIGAALTPAFASDSSSEIVSAAVKVCAVYVGSGIVKELYQLGRVLRLLTSALEKCKDDSDVTAVGEVRDLSPHASVMVKLSVLNAWAELQVASTKQDYLTNVVEPYPLVITLACSRKKNHQRLYINCCIGALKDYARVRLESDIVALASSPEGFQAKSGGGFDSMYSAATKDVILPFYRRSWLKIMAAVASLVESKNEFMMGTLGENEFEEGDSPSDLFYVLFGLCIESLSRVSSSSGNSGDVIVLTICLEALKTFLRRSLAGGAFLPKAVFLELMNVFDRLVQTEGAKIQSIIVEIVQRLVQDYGAEYLCNDLEHDSSDLSDFDAVDRALDPDSFPSTAKLYYLLRLLINIFLQKIPSLSTRPVNTRSANRVISDDAVVLLGSSLDAIASLVAIAPIGYKTDLLAIALYVYTAILQDEKFQHNLAQRVLISVKNILEHFESSLSDDELSMLSSVINASIGTLLDEAIIDRNGNDANQISETDVTMTKNALLASVLILTQCPGASTRVYSGQERFVDVIRKAFNNDSIPTALTALQCTRTLILLPSKKSNSPSAVELGRNMAKALIPHVVLYILSIKSSRHAAFGLGDPRMAVAEEAIKTLLMVLGVAEEEQSAFY